MRPNQTTLLAIVLSFFLLSPVGAQEDDAAQTSPAEQEEAAPPQPPPPIPSASIPARADAVTANLQRVQALIEPREVVATIDNGASEVARTIVSSRQALDALDQDASVRRLQDVRVQWAGLESRLDRWMSTLEDRWQELERERQELRRTQEQWEITRTALATEEAPAGVFESVDQVLDDLSDVENQVRARSQAVATVIDSVSGQRETARDALSRIDRMIDVIRAGILTQNAPPLWHSAAYRDVPPVVGELRNAWEYWIGTLVPFVATRIVRCLALAVFFVIFLITGFALRRRGRSWPEDDRELDRARFITSRPFSAATAFTLVITAFLLRDVVAPLDDVLLMLTLIPFVRLGSGILPGRARPTLYGLALLVVLNRLWIFTPDGSLLQRLLLLLTGGLALAGALVLVRRKRTLGPAEGTRWWRVARVALQIGATSLAIALFTNLFGWSNLAERLTSVTIESTFLAVAWIIMFYVTDALLPLVPRSGIGQVLPSIQLHGETFRRHVLQVFVVVAFALWARRTLTHLEMYDQFWGWMTSALETTWSWGGLSISLGSVLAAVVILFATWLAARLVRFFLSEEVLPRLPLPAGAGNSIQTLINYTIFAFGIVLAAAAAGLSGTQLTVVFGALGVGIGFGLQTIVNNFVSGLILIFERPFKVGDRIQTTDHYGIVQRIGIRASTIRTFDGSEVVVPNGELVSKDVINWTLSDQTRRVDVRAGVAYGTDPKKVLQVLRRVGDQHPLVLKEPEPWPLMVGFGDSSLDFRLLVWTRIEDSFQVGSDLHVAIFDALAEAGIEIPFPQRDLHLKDLPENLKPRLAETEKETPAP